MIKLHALLSELSWEEMKDFDDFVSSPYFNKTKSCKIYFQIVKDHYPDFEISDEEILQSIHPEQLPAPYFLRDIRSKLVKLLLHFLAIQNFEEGKANEMKFLTDALISRGWFDMANKRIIQSEKEIEKTETIGFDAAEWSFRIQEAKLDLIVKSGAKDLDYSYKKLLASLDQYFLARRFEILNTLQSFKQILTYEEEISAIPETLALTGNNNGLGSPLVSLYHQLLKFQTQHATRQELSSYLTKYSIFEKTLSLEKRSNILIILANKFLADLREGVPESLEKAFLVYKKMYESHTYPALGASVINIIRGTISAGARLGEIEWTKKYLNEVKDLIPQDQRESTLSYSYAQLSFHQGDWSTAKKHLLKVEFHSPQVKIAAQNILIKCYFETCETEPFFALIESMKRYLHRHKELAKSYRQGYINFLTLVRHLFDLKWNLGSHYDAAGIIELLEGYDTFFNRDWIKEKVDEIRRL